MKVIRQFSVLCAALFVLSATGETNGVSGVGQKGERGLFGGKLVKLHKEGGDLSSQFKKRKKAKRDNKKEIPHQASDIILDFNGEKLTWGQIDDHVDVRMKMAPLKIPPVATEDEVKQIITLTRNRYAANLVRAYVKNAVLAQEARKLGLRLADGELDEAMTNSVRKMPSPLREQVWPVISASNSYFRLDQANYLLTRKYRQDVLAKGLVVSNEEVEAAMCARQDEIARAKNANAQMRPNLEKWTAEIKAGKRTFAETAENFSDCDSRIDDGEMGMFSQDCSLRPELKAFAFSPTTNEMSGVIETPYAYHVLKVDQRFYDEEAAERADNPEMGLSDAENDDEATNAVAVAQGAAKVPTAVRLSQIMLEKKEIPEALDAATARDAVYRRKLGARTVEAQLKVFSEGKIQSVFPVDLRKKKGKRK